jgi:hypothetical protein
MPDSPNPSSVAPTCVFCGGLPLSGEHVFSDWMGKKGILTDRLRSNGRFKLQAEWSADKTVLEKISYFQATKAKVLNWQVRVPCVECNNGWMSAIVNDAALIVEKLVIGESFVLGEADRELLVRWITLTTIMGEFDDPDFRGIPESDLKAFKATRRGLPNWTIIIGRQLHDSNPVYRHIGTTLALAEKGKSPIGVQPSDTAQVTTLRLGSVYINVVSSTQPALADLLREQVRFSNRVRIVHPTVANEPAVKWPFKRVVTDQAIENLHLRIYSANLRLPPQVEVRDGPNFRPPKTPPTC